LAAGLATSEAERVMNSYPAEWERHERLRDGTRAFVRPIKSEDAALYPDFIAAESAEDARRRFLGAVGGLSDELIARLTHVDYSRAMAFIAIDETDGKMLGVVRLHRQADDPGTGEFAVIIRSDRKRRGLGRLLVRRMIEWSEAAEVRTMFGLVLADNAEMLRLCEQLGFRTGDYAPDRGIKRVTLSLPERTRR
jgi:RimJ/RimL family protein N-acetyltransferase